MKKVQFFILIEAILLSFGMMSILSHSFSSFVLILIIIGLTLKFYNQVNKNNFYLSATLLVLFLMLMLNPFIILFCLFLVLYVIVNYFSQARKSRRYSLISLTKRSDFKSRKNQWLGSNTITPDQFEFDDINLIRFVGNDIIDLTNCIVSNSENVVLIQKVYGKVEIIVPIDVSVTVTVSSIYGKLEFLDHELIDIRNETIKLTENCIFQDVKHVRLVVNCLLGDVEVVKR